MHLHHPMAALLAGLVVGLLGACAATAPPLPDVPVLIYGEQHDQPDHQRQVARDVERLAAGGRLGALVIEMAERGRSTAGLGRDADAAQVRAALGWSGWDWSVYDGVVMAAVRAGVPVLGGNLPRARMREVMGDAAVDTQVSPVAREAIATAVREGHCGALPPAQEPGMVRIQVSRDRSMADAVVQALADHPGRRVVLLAGAGHAARSHGVPVHLAAAAAPRPHVVIFGSSTLGLAADEFRPAQVTPRPDPCIGLRERFARPAG